MNSKNLIFLLLAAWQFAGCASNTVQTDALYSAPINFKPTVSISTPFIEQAAGHCGPATLSMAIAATGNPYKLDEITAQVYSPLAGGSLQENMISSARRQGYLAIPVSGMKALLEELQAGNVVIIFENLGINLIPQWHYALVTGYDLKNKTLTMHSGPNSNQVIDMGEFELSWKLTNYWALLVLQPGTVSASASEITQLQAAAALEKIEKFDAAQRAYLGILEKWPQSLIARIGLGNVYYNQGDYKSAVQILRIAHKLYPDSVEARNNLQVAEAALKNKKN